MIARCEADTELATKLKESSQQSYEKIQVKPGGEPTTELLIARCEASTALAAKLGVSLFVLLQKANAWFTACFSGSVESKSLVCPSGMNKFSAC